MKKRTGTRPSESGASFPPDAGAMDGISTTTLTAVDDVVELVSAIAWPSVVVFAIGVAVTDRGRRVLRPILRRVRKVAGPGGFALELSEDAAAVTKADVEGAVREFSSALRDEFDRLAYAEDVRNRLGAAITRGLAGHQMPHGHGYRATVHVRDALYGDALYQLVDYWPGGGGAGRRFSTRFGILGRAWRLEESQYEDEVPTAPEDLISQWGMSREQAEVAARGRRSFVCVMLRHHSSLVGILYLDAMVGHAFPENIVRRLDESPLVADLAAAVGRVHGGIASRGPGLKVLQSD